jgi:hypothetical protein
MIDHWLATFNRQRVKTAAEMFREEVVFANPEESYRALIEHRQAKAHLSTAGTIKIKGTGERHEISSAKRPFLDAVLKVLVQYDKYLPLTDRQIHYALLNDPPLRHASKPGSRYRNDEKSYKDLCDLVTRARLEGYIDFEDIHDPTRPVVQWDVHASVKPFVRRELDNFLKGFRRDLQQSQPNHIEIVGEKNTIERLVRDVAMRYSIPYTIGRGYSSLPPRYNMAQRFEESGKEKLVLLILSDFDPEGENIAQTFAESMYTDFGVENIHPVKVCLTKAQVEEMGLPPGGKAKKGSSRTAKFVAEHGEDVYELEALPPDRLQALLYAAIDGVMDTELFNIERDNEKRDSASLDTYRRLVRQQMQGTDDVLEN